MCKNLYRCMFRYERNYPYKNNKQWKENHLVIFVYADDYWQAIDKFIEDTNMSEVQYITNPHADEILNGLDGNYYHLMITHINDNPDEKPWHIYFLHGTLPLELNVNDDRIMFRPSRLIHKDLEVR